MEENGKCKKARGKCKNEGMNSTDTGEKLNFLLSDLKKWQKRVAFIRLND